MVAVKNVRVRTGLHALEDGDGRIVQPRPVSYDEVGNEPGAKRRKESFRWSTRETVRACCLRTMYTSIVGTPLTVRRQGTTWELIAGHTLMPGDPGAFENRERRA